MAPPVRAGISKRHVVPTTASRRGAHIERAIWGRAGRRATELAPSLPLSALRRGGRGVRFRAHVSPSGAPRGGPRHDVRRPDRAPRGGARIGDRVLGAGGGAAGDGGGGCAGKGRRGGRGAGLCAPTAWGGYAGDARPA